MDDVLPKPATTDSPEYVVLLDEDGVATGTALKSEVHTDNTPLHQAFSCHLMNEAGEVLVTRRALSKKTWPGVWTNAFCGHPAPGESIVQALKRRAETELGMRVQRIEPLLPEFRYRARDASGVIENEICPVFQAVSTDEVQLNPAECAEYAWVRPQQLRAAAQAAPFAFSPWLVLQLEQLDQRAPHDQPTGFDPQGGAR